jgi:acetyl esterase
MAMARHPDLHPFLAHSLELQESLPPLASLPVAEAREAVRRRMAPVLQAFSPRCAQQELAIPGPGGPLALRLLTPAGEGPYPVILFLHGGGWALCDLDIYQPFADALAAASGAAVLMVDYRLAPEHPFPAALEDAQAALDWLWPHAEAHDLDNSRVALAGDSAGGNLFAVLARGCRDRGGPPLRAQYLAYPVIDLPDPDRYLSYAEVGDDHGLARADIAHYWSLYAGTARPGPDLLPLLAPLEGLPPALIHTAQFDILRSEGEAYAIALEERGVPTHYHCWPGMIHGFLSLVGLLAEADMALRQAGVWLERKLA